MSARDVIAQALHDQIDLRFGAVPWEDDCARVAIEALTAAGFSIVHKDEIHAPSVERAIAVAETTKGAKFGPEPHQYTIATPEWIAAALRELMKEVGRE